MASFKQLARYYSQIYFEGFMAGSIGGFIYSIFKGFTSETFFYLVLGGFYGGIMAILMGMLFQKSYKETIESYTTRRREN